MAKVLFHPFLIFLAHIVNSQLVEEIEYLKAENRIMRSRLGRQVRVTPEERTRLLRFGRPLGTRLKDIISIVTYKTFRNWVAGRIYQRRGEVGRPAIPDEIRLLVVRMALENRSWGYKRILGELKKLDIEVSRSSIQNILRQAELEPQPDRNYSTWNNFIKTHIHTLVSCDFFTKDIWTWRGKITIYIFFFIELGTRRVHLAGMTRYPKQEWVESHSREVLDIMEESGFQPKYLIRDRDGKFSEEFDKMWESNGVEIKKTPVRTPVCNAYAERMVQSIKTELLNHFVVFGEHHLEYLITSYLDYYHRFRPHQGLGNVTIENPPESPPHGEIEKISIIGGLLHHYQRKAA